MIGAPSCADTLPASVCACALLDMQPIVAAAACKAVAHWSVLMSALLLM